MTSGMDELELRLWMLVLSTLHKLLSQVLSLPDLHTALLLTPEGQLISFSSDPARPKDEILVVVGLSGEVWRETRQQGTGMVDSEVVEFAFHEEVRFHVFEPVWPYSGFACGRNRWARR
jgi:hypothetical protein